MSNARRTALYRVAQEALTNVARHAQAGRVEVSIRRLPNAVVMQIEDDGKAFSLDRMWQSRKNRHMGMLGMRERAEMIGGKFEVESGPGRGTTIRVRVPFNGKAARDRTRQ